MNAGPQERRISVPVNVGNVTVGGGAPVVVQSMTNTDTADVERHRAARSRRWRAPAPRSCASPSTATRPPRRCRRSRSGCCSRAATVPIVGDFHYIGHKLLADHPGLRRGARQIPHQSRQCRLQGQEGPPVRRHRRDGDQARQAGAHRRQLGLARSGTAHAPDGREFEARTHPKDAREVTREAMIQSALLSAAARGRDRAWRATASSSPPRCRRCRT